uniref:Uncharacterized protein n=1 Tax=Solanum lycopersicum TaxID=4081 RepID=A0A3Q7GF76_SOLLC
MQQHMKEHDTIILDQLDMSSSAAKNVQADRSLQPTDNAGHTVHAGHVRINVVNVQNVTDIPDLEGSESLHRQGYGDQTSVETQSPSDSNTRQQLGEEIKKKAEESSPQTSNNKSNTRLSKKRRDAQKKDKRRSMTQGLKLNSKNNKRELKKWMNIVI